MVESRLISGQLVELPQYRVRESIKAKHVSLRMTVQGGLEVIIPQGFDQSRIPEILHTKQSWIERTIGRLEAQRQQLSIESSAALPEQLALRAIDQLWQVEYQPTGFSRVTLTEKAKSRLICAAVRITKNCVAPYSSSGSPTKPISASFRGCGQSAKN